MLEKKFLPSDVEHKIYKTWEKNQSFKADPSSRKDPYTIVIPPPNVTGDLHVGHALTMTLQDILIRWKRMQGYDCLWLPGTDHAGIATQLVVERELKKHKGIDRIQLGREEFIKFVWAWKDRSGNDITEQLRRLGASLDWSRERFTMDDQLSHAVRRIFVSLYREGLIYRDKRLVNWDSRFQTAVSDLEVENCEIVGTLWYISYPLVEDMTRSITIATTRPETMLGDTAIAVHPADERFRKLVGQEIVVPLVGRHIPIVADSYPDPKKGTGAMKITPAHDFNDFEVGQRHGLDMPVILDEHARTTLVEIKDSIKIVAGVADPEFLNNLEGMTRETARSEIVKELERLGRIVKKEQFTHSVPHSQRGGAIIEPRLTTQWYCDVTQLGAASVEAVRKEKINFVPDQWKNTFFAWMRDLHPWCISRQLWWGHQIPAWYGPDGSIFVDHDEASASLQATRHYGHSVTLIQDEDVLDTWFSSGSWPFTALGWPEQSKDLKRYYPTSTLVTGFDIIFFWVARMMMMGIHFMKDVPFHKVYLHGLVRDEDGQKMSKSKGNGINPLDMIDVYGADALRYTMASLAGPGRDIRLGVRQIEENRSFVTKLWNAARFIDLKGITGVLDVDLGNLKNPLSIWIINELNKTIEDVNEALESFRFDDYAQSLYRFIWTCFCDWFLEFIKTDFCTEKENSSREIQLVTGYVLGQLLKLAHPVMPFITEELWGHFGLGVRGSLIKANWPAVKPLANPSNAVSEINWLMRVITEIRVLRAEANIPMSQPINVIVRDASVVTRAWIARWQPVIQRIVRVNTFEMDIAAIPSSSAQLIINEATLIIPLEGVIDIIKECNRLQKDIKRVENDIARIQDRLGNSQFIEHAKPDIVDENRQRLKTLRGEKQRLDTAYNRLRQ